MSFRYRPQMSELSVDIEAGSVRLQGDLTIPTGASGLVLFAHGSGSGRHSPRNRFVASELQRAGLATLLFDLLTEEEGAEDEETGLLRFDVMFLATRLLDATSWVHTQPETTSLRIGYFGASTGAAAALIAAAKRPSAVSAVVSRGGRPDLAGSYLEQVVAPTLLIVGSADHEVLALNQEAFELLGGPRDLALVPHATHLFEEPGALEQVARLASAWFTTYLMPRTLKATG
ncbi:MAG: dienelactone hydrolase family protein [Polyangiaceae bacterium]|nr:dienelactone hydrolase family protein [Polyangiaceae bacterium]